MLNGVVLSVWFCKLLCAPSLRMRVFFVDEEFLIIKPRCKIDGYLKEREIAYTFSEIFQHSELCNGRS